MQNLFGALNSSDDLSVREWVTANCSPDLKLKLRYVGVTIDGQPEVNRSGIEDYLDIISAPSFFVPDFVVANDLKLRQNKNKTRVLICNFSCSGTIPQITAIPTAAESPVDFPINQSAPVPSRVDANFVPNFYVTGTSSFILNIDDLIIELDTVSYINRSSPPTGRALMHSGIYD